jgi:hypothetical protein
MATGVYEKKIRRWSWSDFLGDSSMRTGGGVPLAEVKLKTLLT